MVKNQSDNETGNLLHGLFFPISSKGSFIFTILQTGYRDGLEQKSLLQPGLNVCSRTLVGCRGKALLVGPGKENCCLKPIKLPKIAINGNKS